MVASLMPSNQTMSGSGARTSNLVSVTASIISSFSRVIFCSDHGSTITANHCTPKSHKIWRSAFKFCKNCYKLIWVWNCTAQWLLLWAPWDVWSVMQEVWSVIMILRTFLCCHTSSWDKSWIWSTDALCSTSFLTNFINIELD